MHKPVILIVLDGWGHREDTQHNAIAQAKTPFFDSLINAYPHALLDASSLSVGLPEGQMGNSEVGHMTIGAGKTIDTDLVRIDKAIAGNELDQNPALLELFDHIKKHDSTLHIQGLVSPGGVHSHQRHLHGLLHAIRAAGITKIAIHAFTDGRDTPPQSAAAYLKELEAVIEDLGIGFIATATGRFYAMDRDKNWDRVNRAEDALFEGRGHMTSGEKPSRLFTKLYEQGVVDELLEPVVFLDDNGKSYRIEKNDGMLFFNFRTDRARQLSQKILERQQELNLAFVTFTEYDKNLASLVVFPPVGIETTLAAEISKAGLTQAHIAETEKYAHATYFLNGGRQEPHEGEQHILIESRKDIKTHDEAPEMRAKEIADKAVEEINSGIDFLFINFANADMVGHTANVPAIVTAVETVDRELQRVVEAALAKGGVVFITADHGNAETNIDLETRERHTAHTTNLVPAIVTKPGIKLHDGTLADVAPTVLQLMELEKPASMTGKSLIG